MVSANVLLRDWYHPRRNLNKQFFFEVGNYEVDDSNSHSYFLAGQFELDNKYCAVALLDHVPHSAHTLLLPGSCYCHFPLCWFELQGLEICKSA